MPARDPGVRLALDSCRGFVAGWIAAVTVPLLVSPATIAEWSALGLGDVARVALGAGEIAGALLFAFRRVATPGAAILLVAFVVAAVLHAGHGYRPWWLGAYALVVVALERATSRQRPSSEYGVGASAGS